MENIWSKYDIHVDNRSFMVRWVQRELSTAHGPALIFCCICEVFCLFVMGRRVISYPCALYKYKLISPFLSLSEI